MARFSVLVILKYLYRVFTCPQLSRDVQLYLRTINANFSWKPSSLCFHLTKLPEGISTSQNHDDQSWSSFTNHDDDDHNNCWGLTWQYHPPLSNLCPRTFHHVPTALSQDAPEEDREFICQQQPHSFLTVPPNCLCIWWCSTFSKRSLSRLSWISSSW